MTLTRCFDLEARMVLREKTGAMWRKTKKRRTMPTRKRKCWTWEGLRPSGGRTLAVSFEGAVQVESMS